MRGSSVVDTPKAPDPVATAQAQSGMNLDTALTQQLVNFTNTSGPWGSTTYNPTGTNSFVNSQGQTIAVPQFTQTTSYSPEQQAIFDKTTAAQTNIADLAQQQTGSLKNYLNTKFDFGKGEFAGPAAVAPTPFQSGQAPYTGGQFQSGMGAYSPAEFQYGQSPFAANEFSFDNQDAANWSYDLAQQRIAPQQQQDRSSLETQLVNKGIRPGTAAWNSELERLGRTQTDQNNQLALNGRQQAYGEAFGTAQQNYNQGLGARQQNYNEAFGGAQFNAGQALAGRQQNYNEAFGSAQYNDAQALAARQQNFNEGLTTNQTNNSAALAAQQAAYQQALAARGQNFQEAVTGRNQPINEITALLSGSQIANPNNGSTAGPQASVAGVDYTGLVNNNYNQQLASSNAMLGGLFGLAGAGASAATFSDARVKRDIHRVGTLDNGLPVYAYRYVWGGPVAIGVMAQDVEQFRPEAVSEMAGIKAVDYEMAVA